MTKYRQVFTVESVDPIPALHRTISTHPGFQQAGRLGEVSWTEPKIVLEVPTGLGAVVKTRNDIWVRLANGEWFEASTSARRNDAAIIFHLENGATVAHSGIEL